MQKFHSIISSTSDYEQEMKERANLDKDTSITDIIERYNIKKKKIRV